MNQLPRQGRSKNMPEIMVIAPQQEIAELVRELGWGINDVGIIQARLEKGVIAACETVESGARVLVSRGLTYRMIAVALPSIPCVEIAFSGYDILRAYLQANAVTARFAIVDRQEVIEWFCSIEAILVLRIHLYFRAKQDFGLTIANQLVVG